MVIVTTFLVGACLVAVKSEPSTGFFVLLHDFPFQSILGTAPRGIGKQGNQIMLLHHIFDEWIQKKF